MEKKLFCQELTCQDVWDSLTEFKKLAVTPGYTTFERSVKHTGGGLPIQNLVNYCYSTRRMSGKTANYYFNETSRCRYGVIL